MFCPNCGGKNSRQQRFCRSCGLNLEKTAESLAEQFPAKSDESLEKQKDKLERAGVALLSVFGAVGIGILFYLIIFKMILAEGKFFAGFAFLTLIVCALLALLFFTRANSIKDAAAKSRLQQTNELPEDETSAKLLNDSYFEPVPSVTERTTDLLYTERKGDDKTA